MVTEAVKLTLVDRFLLYLQGNGTSIRIKKKRDSFIMTILGKLLFFNKRFMGSYYTTIGNTVYTPDTIVNLDSPNTLKIIAHEAVHVAMRKAHPFLYTVLYLYPQINALWALLAFLPFNGSLLFLIFLIFLFPWPARGRVVLEKWGYLMNLIVIEWRTGDLAKFELEFALDQFEGSAYYWMGRGRKEEIRSWFLSELSKLRRGEFPAPIFKYVFEFVKQEKLVHFSFLGRQA